MMNYPPIDSLMDKMDSKYAMIILASKRARQIVDENPKETKSGLINPVSMALHEINTEQLKLEDKTLDD